MTNTDFKTGVIRPVEIFKEAWGLIKDQYWLTFGIIFVGVIIGSFTMYILLGAMLCGIYFCLLQRIDGKSISFENLWKGFDVLLPSLIVTILIVVPLFVVYLIIYVPFILVMVMGPNLSSDEITQMFIGAIAIDSVLILLMTCLHTLMVFAYPLIIDRKLGAWQSILISSKAVWQNLSGIVGMIGVLILASIPIAFLTCGIGVYFLMPIVFTGYALAYRKIFPAINDQTYNPPSPDAYRGAGSYN